MVTGWSEASAGNLRTRFDRAPPPENRPTRPAPPGTLLPGARAPERRSQGRQAPVAPALPGPPGSLPEYRMPRCVRAAFRRPTGRPASHPYDALSALGQSRTHRTSEGHSAAWATVQPAPARQWARPGPDNEVASP